MPRSSDPVRISARRLLAIVTLIGLAYPSAPASAQTCFGLAPTSGCRVNGVVGPCIGTAGDDRIVGTNSHDVIVGLGGNDRISGRRGDDILCGGDGNDSIRARNGRDQIDGGAGDDRLRAAGGNDVVLGGPGVDDIRSGAGWDTVDGGADDDRIDGGTGNDVIDGGDGSDVVKGGLGVDRCTTDTPPPDCEVTETARSRYALADGCFAMEATDPATNSPVFLEASDSGMAFAFSAHSLESAAPLFMKAADLGVYLLRDDGRAYLVSQGADFERKTELLSDILLVDDTFQSDAEWEVIPIAGDPTRFRLRHLASNRYLATGGLVGAPSSAAAVYFHERSGCAEFPEATVDADGQVQPRVWDDGSVFGFVDAHSHILSNFGFGGGGIYHGSAFHRLGIEHALPDCALFHGEDGRQDLFGYGFDAGDDFDPNALLLAFITGQTPGPNHATAGYPDFTDWPSAFDSATHQVQYYKWLERAWMSGLRLVVQHATTNAVICDFLKGGGVQPTRYECNDMVAVDRIIQETYNMERYIDAQEGGPGRGWFRIVTSPAAAREVINEGKMAVVLGIETSHLFDCFVTPTAEHPACTESDVVERLNDYYERGVRALFPVHKYDNAFSAGDGDKSIIELGNFIQSRRYNNFTDDCDDSVNTNFDRGDLFFPGLNAPRNDYLESPPLALAGLAQFPLDPVSTLLPFVPDLLEPTVPGDFCQNAGLTPLGEFLVEQVMNRGMILELDHLPRRSYKRVLEMLEASDYPGAGTHSLDAGGALYALGGISISGFGRCRDASQPATMDDRFQDDVQLIRNNGGFPAIGFGFDLNGFAGAPGPRFGDAAHCSDVQTDPVTYPFVSYAGDVTFHQPRVGNRTIDFNTEGMAHIGLVAELIEDVRGDGVTDEDLEPLFKSAEGYLRMWEKAEARGAARSASARRLP